MNSPKHPPQPSNRSPDCLMPRFTFGIHQKYQFVWHPQAGAGGGTVPGMHRALPRPRCPWHRSLQHPIDPPRLLQSDQFCIQSRARVSLSLLRKFPAEREVDLQGLQRFLAHPFPRCFPRRCRDLGAAAPRVTRALLAWWHLPEAPFGPDFVL